MKKSVPSASVRKPGRAVAASRQDVLDPEGARLGAVRAPELLSARPVGGGEEEGAADIHEAVGGRRVGAGEDVLDPKGAGLGAVAAPELQTAGSVIGVPRRRRAFPRSRRAAKRATSRIGCCRWGRRRGRLDPEGARFGPIAPPEPAGARGVAGPEEEEPARGGQGVRVRAVRARIDVLDPERAGRGPVAAPQLSSAPVVGARDEKEHLRRLR